MNKTKPIKEKKEKQEKTTKPVRLPRSVQQLIPVKRVFPDSIWQVGNNEFSPDMVVSDINYAVASLDDQRTILDSWGLCTERSCRRQPHGKSLGKQYIRQGGQRRKRCSCASSMTVWTNTAQN